MESFGIFQGLKSSGYYSRTATEADGHCLTILVVDTGESILAFNSGNNAHRLYTRTPWFRIAPTRDTPPGTLCGLTNRPAAPPYNNSVL